MVNHLLFFTFIHCLVKRKRSLFTQDTTALLNDIQAQDLAQQEQNRAQWDRHIQLLLDDAREARELEAELRRQEGSQNA